MEGLRTVRILGHRGAVSAGAIENTVASVRAALDAGAHGVEVDVRRTADGVLVCSHDPSLARLGGPPDPVVALDWATLDAAGLGDGTPVARVADVLDAVAGRGRVVLEVKNIPGEPDFDAPTERTAGLLVDLLRTRDTDDVVVSSFNWFTIEVARDAGFPTGFLTPPGISADACLAYAIDARHTECHPHASEVLDAPGVVAAAHEAGIAVVCWTVDDVGDARRLAAIGVDAVITNDPAALIGALR